jgi:hypothetical protein
MQQIGHVFQEEGIYGPDQVVITLLDDVESPKRTDFLFVETEKGRVLFQVISPLFEYEGFGFEKEAIAHGRWTQIFDSEKLRRAVIAKQLGCFDSSMGIQPYLDAIAPMSKAFVPSSEEIKDIILPNVEHRLDIGLRYPRKDIRIYVDLERVLRQGLLITGGVGTGKTTTLGTMIFNLLSTKDIEPHLLLLDPDGELGSDEIRKIADSRKGYIQLSCGKRSLFVRESSETPSAFAKLMCEAFGISETAKEGKAIRSCARLAQNSDIQLSPKNFTEILSFLNNEETKELLTKRWEESKGIALSMVSPKNAYDVPELVGKKTIVHIDGSTTKDFNNFLHAALVSLENCFNAAVRREIGLIAVIDEAHLLAPQNESDYVGDEGLHKNLASLLKSRIATTGPRNGMGLWLTTQRLAKLDKTLSTQTGQNLIAHGCEDVDFLRLKEIVGDQYAESARMLPKGHALVKSTGLRIFNAPVLVSIEKKISVRSSETSLLNRWKQDFVKSKTQRHDAGAFM